MKILVVETWVKITRNKQQQQQQKEIWNLEIIIFEMERYNNTKGFFEKQK